MADLSTLKGVPGQKNWYSLWTQNIDYLQNVTTEVETARQGQANLNAALNQYVLKSGWTANFNAMNYRLTGLADPVNPQDAVNLQTAQALVSGGGVPSNIPITALGIGTATALQLYRVNVGGTAIEGVSSSNLSITSLNKGTGQNGQVFGIENDQIVPIDLSYLFEFYGRM